MADLSYTATKRSPEVYQFAFMVSSLPDPDDTVVDGNDSTGIVDGN